LHLVRAELAVMEQDEATALEYYSKAAQLGRPHPAAVVQHVRLLVGRGQFQLAKEIVERLPAAQRQVLLGQLYAEILLNTGAIDEAIRSGKTVIEQDPTNGMKQLWYGQLLARATQLGGISEAQEKDFDREAGEAIAKSVELAPDNQQAWLALVSYHLYHKDREAAEDALRRAQLALSSDLLPIVMAKSYEMMGRAFDAENLYRSLLETEPENVGYMQQLAVFYLGNSNAFAPAVRVAKAQPLINQILKLGAEKKLATNDPNLLWARRTAANILAETGDYQNLLKAEKLLASNSQDGLLPLADRLQMAQILAPRPEPISRKKALALLENVKSLQRLNLAAELVMGQLYFALGDWPRCRRQMQEVIAHFPESAQSRDAYIRMLLKRGRRSDLDQAENQLDKLVKLGPLNSSTMELMARVAAKQGSVDKARAALLSVLPKKPEDWKDDQLPLAERIGDLLLDLGEKDAAGYIYQELFKKNQGKFVLKMADFLGKHHEVEQGLGLLEKVYTPEQAPGVVQIALGILRHRRDDVGDIFDEKVGSWLERGLRENPESIPMLLQQAELYDLQSRYQEAAAVYQKLLARQDVVGRGRAIVLNNLSYLLALEGESASTDPMKLVEEAVRILGPTTDILDTRAVVRIARGDYEAAVADLELSVTDNPTESKYFHKAVAHLGAEQNSQAIESWDLAVEYGLTRDVINRLERERFDDTKAKIDRLRTANAGISASSSSLSSLDR
jgi:tetratricopeptide (TPR) repeat protein